MSIGANEASQLKEYAAAIASDSRFRDTRTRWDFWAVSREVSASVAIEANQKDRPTGLLIDSSDPPFRVWVRTWGQLIEDCRSRLQFFRDKLEYEATEASGVEYLRKVHQSYLPSFLHSEKPENSQSWGRIVKAGIGTSSGESAWPDSQFDCLPRQSSMTLESRSATASKSSYCTSTNNAE